MILDCRTCGPTENYRLRRVGPHLGSYCCECGDWIQWIRQTPEAVVRYNEQEATDG